ncbi:MAG: DUF5686 and carboxypeptidase regulatory-like domain-containing protein [Candidatus Kapabacteria bacterium]|jgi:hypothetical protein|nr:DUF5686 and carboxypeptidase regulatory-like domain-containing protein [Candidatus Kapabacteria bacterium]
MSVFLLAITSVILVSATVAHTQTTLWTGTVRSSANGEGLDGAGVRVLGTNKGTYTRSGGRFRLNLPTATYRLIVRSVGHADDTIRVTPDNTTLDIVLKELPSRGRMMTVTADISAEEVIRRAIERRKENADRIQTAVFSIYSKMRSNIGVDVLTEADTSNSIQETFATVYEQRKPNLKKHTVIRSRRQTKNIPAAANLTVFDDFFDFTTDELKLFATTLTTPLGKDALDDYRFTMQERTMIGKDYVYVINFEPKSRLFPGFEGQLSIIERTYNVVQARFAPTSETALPFIKGLTFEQRYERTPDSIWVPTYQFVTGRFDANILTGLASVGGGIAVQAYVTDVAINGPIADSIFAPRNVIPKDSMSVFGEDEGRKTGTIAIDDDVYTTVVDDADSAKPEFWDRTSVAEQSDEERELYRKVDSIEANKKPKRRDDEQSAFGSSGGLLSYQFGPVGVAIDPIITRTTVTNWLYGADAKATVGDVVVRAIGALGDRETQVGSVGATWTLALGKESSVKIGADVFSNLGTLQNTQRGRSDVPFVDAAEVIYAERSDFFRREGWSAFASAEVGRFDFRLGFEDMRHRRMDVLVPPGRPSLAPAEGAFRVASLAVSAGKASFLETFLDPTAGWPVRPRVSASVGQNVAADAVFQSVHVSLATDVPTFSTGYAPMMLAINVGAGIASTNTPVQFQFNAFRRFEVFGEANNLMTVPINAFGGTQVVQLIAEHNFTDLWWRALGLPTVNNRGIDLLASYGAMRFVQQGESPLAGFYRGTPDWYQEAGFGLARIPTFLSDFLFLRFDARWPVGTAKSLGGTFGWSIGLSSPLF